MHVVCVGCSCMFVDVFLKGDVCIQFMSCTCRACVV